MKKVLGGTVFALVFVLCMASGVLADTGQHEICSIDELRYSIDIDPIEIGEVTVHDTFRYYSFTEGNMTSSLIYSYTIYAGTTFYVEMTANGRFVYVASIRSGNTIVNDSNLTVSDSTIENLTLGNPISPPIRGNVKSYTFNTSGEYLVIGHSVDGYGSFGSDRVNVIIYFNVIDVDTVAQPVTLIAANEVNVTINGVAQNFDVAPQIIDGRTMLPLRAIGEALGMEVSFDSATNTATLTAPNTNITHVINTTQITVNGTVQTFDVASTIIDGRTLVPVRMLAEAIGADVDWNSETRTAEINTN